MKVCPFCGHTKTGINGTESKDPDSRRYRVCLSCGKPFTTIEVVVVNTGGEWAPLQQETARPSAVTSYRRVSMPPDSWGLPYQLAIDISHWWEVARWSKHGNKAVWTERAFNASLSRVQQLHLAMPERARELVAKGVENGWMGLDPKFLNPREQFGRFAPTAQATPLGPKSPAMQAAVESWHDNP
jgi:hypothetical protein